MRSLIGGLRTTVVDRAPTYVAATGGGRIATALGLTGGSTTQALRGMESVGTLFGVVDAIASAVGQSTWHLYRTAKSGKPEDRVEVVGHAALDVWHQPNPFMTTSELLETLAQHYELTGEQWLVISSDARAKNLPLELWPVRPDRMRPLPHATKFLAGYEYSIGSETVPLALDEVIFIRRPNPLDIYRGLGPVQAILADIDSAKYSAVWNRNFFLNSAEPGGIIQFEEELSDDDFRRLRDRWREQHQGVAQAHRVAILEGGKWVDRKFTQRDMQFVELRHVSREIIREAWRLSKTMLGQSEDVNRATAQAAEYVFSKWLIVPRLERIKQALNTELLPRFGATAVGLEFDYDSPVGDDEDAQNAERDSKVAAYVSLVRDAGVDPASAAQTVGLPEMVHVTNPAVPAPRPAEKPVEVIEPHPDEDEDDQEEDEGPDAAFRRAAATLLGRPTRSLGHRHDRGDVPVAEAPPLPNPPAGIPRRLPDGAGPDLEPVQIAWDSSLSAVLAQWLRLEADQRDQVIGQLRDVIATGNVTMLRGITVLFDDGATVLLNAMEALAAQSAMQVVAEAAAQEVEVSAGIVTRAALAQVAEASAGTLADGLVMSAVREALRVWGPTSTPAQVTTQVREHLESLTDAQPRYVLGGALTHAQHAGREATILAGPSAALYADEVLDRNTCVAPDTLVITRGGEVYAKDVTLDDELLTHAGYFRRPSAIVVSHVEEELRRVRVASGRTLRLTYDHPVLVRTPGGFAWREAGQLAVGDVVVCQLSGQPLSESVGADVVLGDAPDGVPAVRQVLGLAPVDVRAQGVPVAPVRLDDEGTDEEVDHPGADLRLRASGEALTLQDLPDHALDARLSPAGPVAASRAEAAPSALGRDDADLLAAVSAVDEDWGAAARLGAVGPRLLPAVPEGGSATEAGRGAAASVHAAGTGAVVIPAGVRGGDGELLPAVRADLGDSVRGRHHPGGHLRVGVLALDRAVRDLVPVPASDLSVAGLAAGRRVVRTEFAPPGEGSAAAAPGALPDLGPAVRTRLVHDLILLPVVGIDTEHYSGEVYDFTVPEDETFWAEGVLVHNCRACRKVHRKWLGNSDDPGRGWTAWYPVRGYLACEGRDRCRGQVIAVWRGGSDWRKWIEQPDERGDGR